MPRTSVLQLPTCVVDLANRRLVRPTGEERLSGREVELIAYFHARQGQLVTREELERDLWKFKPGVQSEAVPVAIRRLRARIEEDPKNPAIVVTDYGQGWRMLGVVPEEPVWAAPVLENPAERPSSPVLIGRVAALADLEQGWAHTSLQTLVGPGGVGKTTLAKAASPPGSLFIDLQHATTIAQCLEAARSVLPGLHLAGLHEEQVIERIHRRLAEVPLVVLDNAEQVVAEVARIVPSFPRARLLVTSRVRLGAPDERVVLLQSLDPDEAEALFRRRYQDAGGRADLDPEQLRALLDRLDRLPLAIELLAPRARLLPLTALIERLGRGLDAIPQGRGRAPRHASMRACLQWGWEMLPASAQDTLRAAAAFCTELCLEDLEQVLGRDPIDDLEVLLDASMIASSQPGNYAVRVLLRSFVAEQGGHEPYLQAHARVLCARLAEVGQGMHRVPTLTRWIPELEQIVRVADDPTAIATAAMAIHEAVLGDGLGAVARDALLLGIERCTDPGLRAQLQVCCVQATYTVDPRGALERLRAIDIELLPDPLELLGLQGNLSRLGHGEPPDLEAWARAIEASPGPPARPLTQLALCQLNVGQVERARATIDRAVAESRIDPNLRTRVRALRSHDYIWSSEVSGPGGSGSHLREALALAEASGMRFDAARCRANLAVEIAATDRRAAEQLFLAVERDCEALGDAASVHHSRANRAVNAWFLGEPARAVELFEAVDHGLVDPGLKAYHTLFETVARYGLGHCDAGAVEAALAGLAAHGSPYECVLCELLEALVLDRALSRSPAEAAAALGYLPLPADIATCVALLAKRDA